MYFSDGVDSFSGGRIVHFHRAVRVIRQGTENKAKKKSTTTEDKIRY